MSNLIHRKGHKDAEHGDPEKEAERQKEAQKKRKSLNTLWQLAKQSLIAGYDGEEYESLLLFVEDQAAKIKSKSNDNDDEEEKNVKYTRKWYAPWKKTKVDSGVRNVCHCFVEEWWSA